MLKSIKGQFGYFKHEKKRRLLITVILFAVPMLIFVTGLLRFHTRETLFTVVAVVGCLPACKSLVNLIMVLMRQSISREEYDSIRQRAGDLTMVYEMYITTYEKSGYVDAFAICGNQVVGYSSDPRIDVGYMSEQIQKILHKNGYGVKVFIQKDLNPYLRRLESLVHNREELEKDIPFTPDEKYPDLSREELIKHTILAISI